MDLTLDVLRAQDDKTSAAIMESLKNDAAFDALAKQEMEGIIGRDNEDGDKLQVGVDVAVKNGVLPGDKSPPKYEQIDVFGKTGEQVAGEIYDKLPKDQGCVVILVGLSGTGKGTTVSKLSSMVANSSTWSNGNIFRSITLLAATHCEKNGMTEFDPGCLTAENLKEWMTMLEFDKFDGKFDTKISGLVDAKVSDICNTLLKEPKVSKNIPTVAEKTQAEVVKFAGDACIKMAKEGTVVLVEGREQTLNFIDSPHRFCLMLSDPIIIGQRRAAQRIAAEAGESAKDGDDAGALVKAALENLAK